MRQPFGAKSVDEYSTEGSSNANSKDCHGQHSLAPVEPFFIGDFAFLKLGHSNTAERSLHSCLGDPSKGHKCALLIVVFALQASGESSQPAATNSNNDDNNAKTKIFRIDLLEKDTSTYRAEKEWLAERPEYGKFVFRLVLTPLLVTHVTKEDDANKLGFVKLD